MNAEQAKIKNIIDMAFGFSAMTRVFRKESTEEIVCRLTETLPQIASSKDDKEFENLHDDFCHWFERHVKTPERHKKNGTIEPSHSASYGQGAKVLDVALKVYVYYCHLPDPETAERITQWLNSAIDTKMMGYLKGLPGGDAVNATSIEQVKESTYTKLQALVRKDVERNFPTRILPVQWDDIKWRELNNKDKKRAEILEHNQGRTNSSNVCKVRASITGQTNTYKTGVESGQEILEISLSKPGYNKHNIPWANLVGVKLTIGRSIYDGTLNLKRKDGIPWISSVINDSKGKKLALRTPLIASGYNKGDSVNLQININKKEIAILPLVPSG